MTSHCIKETILNRQQVQIQIKREREKSLDEDNGSKGEKHRGRMVMRSS